MRYGCTALLMLLSSAVAASAQDRVTELTQVLDARVNGFTALNKKAEARVSPDEVIARLMSFDRNGDGNVAIDELSERMQPLVARGDRGGDGALDASEIRSLMQTPLQFAQTAFRNLSGGGYGFGDTVGQTSRTHIENTIEDLRLAARANEEAKRLTSAFADEMEGKALANLRHAIAPVLTEQQLATFEANLKNGAGNRVMSLSVNGNGNGNGTTQTIVLRTDPSLLLLRQQMPPEQLKTVAAALETFRSEQQLDDVRRSALVAQLSGILTDEERDNFSAALARRPLVKGLGALGNFQATIREDTIRREFPGNGAPVREIGFTNVPVAPTSR